MGNPRGDEEARKRAKEKIIQKLKEINKQASNTEETDEDEEKYERGFKIIEDLLGLICNCRKKGS